GDRADRRTLQRHARREPELRGRRRRCVRHASAARGECRPAVVRALDRTIRRAAPDAARDAGRVLAGQVCGPPVPWNLSIDEENQIMSRLVKIALLTLLCVAGLCASLGADTEDT